MSVEPVAPATTPDIAEAIVEETLKEAEATLEQTASEPVLITEQEVVLGTSAALSPRSR